MEGDLFHDDDDRPPSVIKMMQTKMIKHKTNQLHSKLC